MKFRPFFVLIFLLPSIVCPAVYFIRRLRRKASEAARLAGSTRLRAGLIGVLNLVFIIGVALTLQIKAYEFVYSVPPFFIALLCTPLATTILTVALIVLTVLAWKNVYWSVMRRSYYSFITLAALVFIGFLNYWNLLGFRF